MDMKAFWDQNKIWLSIVLGVLVLVAIGYSRDVANDTNITVAVLSASLRASTPLVLGALCGILCERSGIVNIGIEGQILVAAFVSFVSYSRFGDSLGAESVMALPLALLMGLLSGAAMGWLLAFMSVTLKLDQIIGGTVINILALGITGYYYQQGLLVPSKLQAIEIPLLSQIPVLGPVFFNNGVLTYLTLILIVSMHFVLYRTVWGLRTRAVGEHPRAADTVGINVYYVRYVNVIAGGVLAGLAGSYLVLEAVGTFERGMSSGRGFVALAVMLFGKRTPFGAWGAALLFGFASALQTQLQFFGTIDIPHQFIGMLPYVLTILVLAGFVGRTRDPKALAQPYSKE